MVSGIQFGGDGGELGALILQLHNIEGNAFYSVIAGLKHLLRRFLDRTPGEVQIFEKTATFIEYK